MSRRVWSVLALALVIALGLGLAGCGDDDEPEPPDTTPDAAPDATATVEPDDTNPDELNFSVYEPGLHVESGLTVTRISQGEEGDTGYVFAEVRNETGALIASVDTAVFLLDELNLRLGSVSLDALLNDIPPDQTFFVGRAFTQPDGVTDRAVWIDYNAADAPSLRAYYDLPVTITEQGPGENTPYRVSGTIENTSGEDLYFWDITLVALDAEGDLVGLTRAVLQFDTPDRVWTAGAAQPFEATFSFVAGGADAVASVETLAAGYAPLE